MEQKRAKFSPMREGSLICCPGKLTIFLSGPQYFVACDLPGVGYIDRKQRESNSVNNVQKQLKINKTAPPTSLQSKKVICSSNNSSRD